MIAPAAVGCKPMLAGPMAPLGRGVRIVAGYELPERFWKRSHVSKFALAVSQNCRNRPRPAGFARGGEAILDATLVMNTWEHEYVGPLMHDRIIGALELCCRLGEMLLIQNKRVDWESHTIGIPGHATKDKENRRIPFDPNGALRRS